MVKTKRKEQKRVKYTANELKEAVYKIKSGEPIRKVSRDFGIPKTTLLYKKNELVPSIRRSGPPTVLTDEEENQLVEWIFHMHKAGYPITKAQIINSVTMLVKELKRDNPFKNGRPGRSWLESFQKRHPELTQRIAQNLTNARASVTEKALREWFAEINSYFNKNGLCNIDPSRIFNCDESAFFLCPKGEKVFVKKGEKCVYNFVQNDEKECLTTLFMVNAEGMLGPPLILFSYERIPYSICASIPESWGIGKTDNGWMTGESFYEYIANVFHPWLVANNIQFPIVLYVDGHSSHLTMSLSNFCSKHGIHLIALYPNATHILQPLDVAFFHPLKHAWRKIISEWRLKSGHKIRKNC
ncbi:MFS-type transporter clz9-like [Osmia bicornis bicornis]|uniref:MFS-type transporter clz9-like n=1 Tax=Osmia bicornis bicornis TaxID=1437191 RepID=UPI001EAF5BE3|nr:MFS-type transporter clz9-like [Osmia bicornis bicornis]